MKRFLGLFLVLLLVSAWLTGCASAKFEVSELTITPNKVVAGETYTVSANISNVGDAVGVYTAILIINGIERATKDIAIVAGGTEEVSFTLVEETPGNYGIALNDVTASFDVIKLPSAQEMVDMVLQSIYNVETYQFDYDQTMHIKGEENRKPFETNITYGEVGWI